MNRSVTLALSVFGLLSEVFFGGCAKEDEKTPAGVPQVIETKVAKEVVVNEVRRRRMLRGSAYEPFAPAPTGPVQLKIADMPMIDAAQVYADLSRREVLCSAKVSALCISASTPAVAAKRAVAELESAFARAQIRLVKIDEDTVALVRTGE